MVWISVTWGCFVVEDNQVCEDEDGIGSPGALYSYILEILSWKPTLDANYYSVQFEP